MGLYPSVPHEAGLRALREVFDKREQHTIPTSELIRMADFVLKNNYFEFNGQIKQQISGTAIGARFAPTYAYLFMCICLNELHNDIQFTYESSKEII